MASEPMKAMISRIGLAVFAILLALSFLLPSAPGGGAFWVGSMVAAALLPLAVGPFKYRFAGALALAIALLFVVVEIAAERRLKTRLNLVRIEAERRQEQAARLPVTSAQPEPAAPTSQR